MQPLKQFYLALMRFLRTACMCSTDGTRGLCRPRSFRMGIFWPFCGLSLAPGLSGAAKSAPTALESFWNDRADASAKAALRPVASSAVFRLFAEQGLYVRLWRYMASCRALYLRSLPPKSDATAELPPAKKLQLDMEILHGGLVLRHQSRCHSKCLLLRVSLQS